MKLFRIAGALAALAVTFAVAAPANAVNTETFTFNISGASDNLGAPPYGTVTVTENGGALDFVVTLAAGFLFHTSPNQHDAFAFNLVGSPAITYSNMTSGFFAAIPGSGEPPFTQSPFGDFQYAIDCSCAQGLAGPLSFTVSAGSPLTLASLSSLLYNGQNLYFSADVLQTATGFTGNIGATLGGGVPEPATWAMMILGFAMVGMGLRLRRRPEATLA